MGKPIEGVVPLHESPSRNHSQEGIPADLSQTGRVLAAARRLVDDALDALRFRTVPRRRTPLARPYAAPWEKHPSPASEIQALTHRLLGREPIAFQAEALRSAVEGRAILVTGAAGSIGSELCRQVAELDPRLLVAFDNAESGLFHLDQDLRGGLEGRFVPWIGDIRDPRRIQDVFERYSIDTVFHAAAYKHVPLMESHPLELMQTNVMGTWNLARASAGHGVGRFVLISTDKAVNPANVMGLTKRVAELIVTGMGGGGNHSTRFTAVRFGNVLGSSGSVVPVFHEQIARGGPVTVTHPDVSRFFMTTREAVHLVLQASAMAEHSGVFVLDMGEPVRIVELARQMIRSWGLEPDRDIGIHFVGLRPGEKLGEELVASGERPFPTFHPRINALRGRVGRPQEVDDSIDQLRCTIEKRDGAGAVARMAALVPEYEPGNAWPALARQRSASAPAAFAR